MYHPTTRVLTVLELLQAHRRLSGPELAMRLEVDPRTVRHYITLLQDLGIPIESERGRHGGYQLRPGFKLPPLMFSEDEALALTLGLLVARQVGLAATSPAVEGALAKIERVMPDALRARIQSVQSTLVIGDAAHTSAPASAMVLTFSMATRQRQRIQMRYRAWHERVTERTLDPYGVVFYDSRWFVVGYCHLRSDLRMFRLDRVIQATICDQKFTRPPDFEPLAFVVQSLANTPGAWSVEVLLSTTLDQAQQVIPAAMATLVAMPGGVLLRCRVEHLDWMARLLVGWEFPFRVCQPPELRDALRRLSTQIMELANLE